MATLLNLTAVLDRQQEIAAEIEALQAERTELDNALKVLGRFATQQASKGVPMDTGPPKPKLGAPRPEGTPSLYDMTVEVLKEAIAKGAHGLKGREIVAEIGKKYWPGVQPEQVLPPIYGFVGKKRLKKNSEGVFRPVD